MAKWIIFIVMINKDVENIILESKLEIAQKTVKKETDINCIIDLFRLLTTAQKIEVKRLINQENVF